MLKNLKGKRQTGFIQKVARTFPSVLNIFAIIFAEFDNMFSLVDNCTFP